MSVDWQLRMEEFDKFPKIIRQALSNATNPFVYKNIRRLLKTNSPKQVAVMIKEADTLQTQSTPLWSDKEG